MTGVRTALLPLALLAVALPLAAESPPRLDELIGMDVAQAVAALGSPDEVVALRGEEEWQDEAVFSYAGLHLSLYWFQGRVWQARLDDGFRGSAYGVRMGQDRKEVLQILGQPWQSREDSLLYELEDRGYPIRLHLFFAGGLLSDLYCYRGDL